jgi:hypothetical protein
MTEEKTKTDIIRVLVIPSISSKEMSEETRVMLITKPQKFTKRKAERLSSQPFYLEFMGEKVLFDHRKVIRWLILDGEIWGLEISKGDWAEIEDIFRSALRKEKQKEIK